MVGNSSEIENSQRCFLFLQGPPSGFSKKVGKALQLMGHKVVKVNFCLGDMIYWAGKNVACFRGNYTEWEQYIKELMIREGITDVVYYADRLPYHVVAAKVARDLNIAGISFEFGYLRPDWIVLERGGQSIYSHFPADLIDIKDKARGIEEPDNVKRYSYSFVAEAFNEVSFNLANFFGWFIFPGYRPDKYYNPLFEYISYIQRLMNGKRNEKKGTEFIEALIEDQHPFFVFPLQMQNDYQIRCNSPQVDLLQVAEATIRSFAGNAADEDWLIFKIHPLDNGLIRWKRQFAKLSKQYGVSGRVHCIDGGDLHKLFKHAEGAVVVNSTTGLQALELGTPTKALGIAVYDIPGLTNQMQLDEFWNSRIEPDREGVEAFVRLMAHAIHIKGDFYSVRGQKAAAAAMAQKLSHGQVNSHGCFINPPPRIEKAKALGMQVDYC